MRELDIQMFADEPAVEPQEKPEVEKKANPQPQPQVTTPENKVGHNDLIRELSRTFSVNLFDADGLDQLKSKLAKDKEAQASFKNDYDELQKNFSGLQAQIARNAFDVEALSLGVKKEQLDDVYALSLAKKGEGSISDGLKATLEQYQQTFGQQGRFGGVVRNEVPRGDQPLPTGDVERYLAKSSKVQLYAKQQERLNKK